jgi:ubiquinone/menaquinone biosynthesis C-methylase UbiE
MSSLYDDLSEVYEAMYHSFIDYDEEFSFYKKILLRHMCNSLLEIGCGTGNLAGRFLNEKFDYTGLDLSDNMLNIARTKYPTVQFLKADMRNFAVDKRFDSALITGRTISYLISNQDVADTFTTLNGVLKSSGILCFDAIDATKFIPDIWPELPVVHEATRDDIKFHRESFWKINLAHNWTFDWRSVYFTKEARGTMSKLGEDNSTIRTFTKEDMALFLKLSGFEVVEVIDRPSYAFETFVMVATKK